MMYGRVTVVAKSNKTTNVGWKMALAASALCAAGWAQAAWPEKPITMVVPWPAGGPSDIAARPLSKGLTDALGQTVIIDNRAGAGGNIGSNVVAKAKPDGHAIPVTKSGCPNRSVRWNDWAGKAAS